MAELQTINRDLTILVLFSLNIVGLFFLFAKGVQEASFYFSLAMLFPTLFFLIWFFIGNSQIIFKKIPIKQNTVQGTQMFVVGFLLVIFMRLLGIVSSKFMQPQFMFGQKLFQAFAIGESRFWNFYITSFTAGIIEELVFGLTFVAIGIIFAYWFRNQWGLDFGETGNYYFQIIIGSAFSIIPFVIFHQFNPTYTTQMFIIAGIFRFLMNIVIWTFGSITFGMGYHIANNMLALSFATVIGALFSPLGLIILLIFGTMIINAIRNWKEIDTSFGLGDIIY